MVPVVFGALAGLVGCVARSRRPLTLTHAEGEQLSEAERLHSGLVASFSALAAASEGSAFEDAGAYVSVTFPAIPLAQANGVWAEDDGGATVADLAGRVVEIEGTVPIGDSVLGYQPV